MSGITKIVKKITHKIKVINSIFNCAISDPAASDSNLCMYDNGKRINMLGWKRNGIGPVNNVH